jgi:outer membrane biosynthesis protein TonB
MPAVPATAVGGGEVILEVTIDSAGRVSRILPLRTTPPFTQPTVAAVRAWQFAPATEGPTPVESNVLVAAVFHAPTLNTPTLGERPRDVAAASPAVAFPLNISVPGYPPSAAGGGVVLIEARVDERGRLLDTLVRHSALPFDNPAQMALAQWTFVPPRVQGSPHPTVVYVMFGFPVPVVGRPPAVK